MQNDDLAQAGILQVQREPADDPEAAALLEAILAEERENVNKLQQLANSQTAEPPHAV